MELYRWPDSSVRTLIRGRDATNSPEVVRLCWPASSEKEANHLAQLPLQEGEGIVISTAGGLKSRRTVGALGTSRAHVFKLPGQALRCSRDLLHCDSRYRNHRREWIKNREPDKLLVIESDVAQID